MVNDEQCTTYNNIIDSLMHTIIVEYHVVEYLEVIFVVSLSYPSNLPGTNVTYRWIVLFFDG